tara:strand:- start:744 stop:995 length:252 start_codon:yes stop_codon:yes gene_type:complete
MRQKLITLCPTSFELAGKKANFSAWVRRKLMEEQKIKDYEYVPLYAMYCKPCNEQFHHPNIAMAETYKCRFCLEDTEFQGLVE